MSHLKINFEHTIKFFLMYKAVINAKDCQKNSFSSLKKLVIHTIISNICIIGKLGFYRGTCGICDGNVVTSQVIPQKKVIKSDISTSKTVFKRKFAFSSGRPQSLSISTILTIQFSGKYNF